MNLLEVWIVEVYSVKELVDPIEMRGMLEIDAMTNCYGQGKRETLYFRPEQWEEVKEKGFYLG